MSDSYSKKELELLFLPLVLQESILSRQSGPVIVSRDYGGVKNKVSITLSGGVHKGKRLPLPSGVMGRRLLYWLVREAKRADSPEIQLCGSKSLFEQLGLQRTSYQARKLKQELLRLTYMNITIESFPTRLNEDKEEEEAILAIPNIPVFDKVCIWNIENNRQLSLFDSELVFSARFFQAILSEPHQPVRAEAVKNIKSALGIDIYLWLARRTQTIGRPSKTFVWRLMKEQFGREGEKTSNFKKLFTKAFGEACEQIITYGGPAGHITAKGVVINQCPQQVESKEYREETSGWGSL